MPEHHWSIGDLRHLRRVTYVRTDLTVIEGNGEVHSMLLQLCACVHPLHCFPAVLTQQQHHNIHKGLCTVLAEEVWAPFHHLSLEVSQGVGRSEEVRGRVGAEARVGAAGRDCGLHHVELQPHEVLNGAYDGLLLHSQDAQKSLESDPLLDLD